jgi:hypothetical protein
MRILRCPQVVSNEDGKCGQGQYAMNASDMPSFKDIEGGKGNGVKTIWLTDRRCINTNTTSITTPSNGTVTWTYQFDALNRATSAIGSISLMLRT